MSATDSVCLCVSPYVYEGVRAFSSTLEPQGSIDTLTLAYASPYVSVYEGASAFPFIGWGGGTGELSQVYQADSEAISVHLSADPLRAG